MWHKFVRVQERKFGKQNGPGKVLKFPSTYINTA